MNAQADTFVNPIVVRDADGSWTVRENEGGLLGRFPSWQAAGKFAERMRRSGHGASVAPARPTSHSRLLGKLSLTRNRKSDEGAEHV